MISGLVVRVGRLGFVFAASSRKAQKTIQTAGFSVSPIWRDQVLFRPKVDKFVKVVKLVPHAQHANVTIVSQPD